MPPDRPVNSTLLETSRKARRLWLPAAVFLVGASASFLLFSAERSSERLRVLARFSEAANSRSSAIRRAFEHGVDTIESIVALFAASEVVTPEEFRRFVEPLLAGHPAVQGVSWAPLVARDERTEVERRLRDRDPKLRLTSRSSQGEMVAAPEAEEYVPVLYLEPLAGNEAALGFDLASDPHRRQSLEAARESGSVAATGRIRLVQETGDQYGFLLIAPIYRQGADRATPEMRRAALEGFATAVFRAGDLVDNSVALLEPAGIDIAVLDDSAPPAERLLHASFAQAPGREAPAPASFLSSSSRAMERRASFDFGGRRWSVVTRAAPGAFELGLLRPRLTLVGGLTISGMISALFFLLRSRAADLARSNRALHREIEIREDAEERLRLFQSIIDASAEAIYFVDPETGRFQYANEKAVRESGYGLSELRTLTVRDVVAEGPVADSAAAWPEWMRSLQNQPATVLEGRQRKKDGSTFPVELSVSLAEIGDQRFVVGIVEDISERKRAQAREVELRERLLALSFLDGLTGIANRRRFDEYLSTEWRRAARQGTSLGLILIDLDHFKLYNDRYGHLLGDECLRKVAAVLDKAVSRPADLVARFGGEEMAMLLPETSENGAARMAEKIRIEVEALGLEHKDSPVAPVVTISVGYGWTNPTPGDFLDRFLGAVDAALYRAKREGRNRSVSA